MPDPGSIPESDPRSLLWMTLYLVYETFRNNKLRFFLVALGMTVGSASLIMVVTIGMAGKQYVVTQIRSIGVNMIDAEYQGGGEEDVNPDRLNIDDMKAVREQVFGIVAASPVIQVDGQIPIGDGREKDIRMLGVFPDYQAVRSIVVLSGRFFDTGDEQARNKVGVVEEKLAKLLYGSVEQAVGREVKLNGFPFTIIGSFKERVDTFGQSEVSDDTLLIPYSVSRLFRSSADVDQLYFSAGDPSMVVPVTKAVRKVIQSRHRPESNYIVQNLTSLMKVADRTGSALTLVLLLIAAVTLFVSGIGIMNIMLATVSSRAYEIGVRKAVGASSAEIRLQFLGEAVLISLVGALVGIVIGLALPFSIRMLTHYRVPVSGYSAVVALAVAMTVGIVFGTLPANRAARLDPIESLRKT